MREILEEVGIAIFLLICLFAGFRVLAMLLRAFQ